MEMPDTLRPSAMTPHEGVIERIRQAAERLLSSPRFHRWAAAFPLTRHKARREARALFDLCAGFVYSQVLLACVRLKLFELLADGPLSAQQLALRTGLSRDAAGGFFFLGFADAIV